MIVQVTRRLYRVYAQLAANRRLGKDFFIIVPVERIVCNMLNDDGSLLIVDDSGSLDDEILWIVLELGEHLLLDALQNGDNILSRQFGFFDQLSNQIILDAAARSYLVLLLHDAILGFYKCLTGAQSISAHRLHFAGFHLEIDF